MKRLSALEPLGLLVLRVAVGMIFMYHGYPKLIHGGSMKGMFAQHGLPGYFVFVAAVLEFFGGGLVLLGLFTRVAALLLAIEMGVAIWKVHSGGGIMAVHNYEFPLSMGAASFALATVGAGMVSLDWPLFEGGGRRAFKASKPK